MILDPSTILTAIQSQWSLTDPLAADIDFTSDEFDPNSVKVQILIENIDSTDEWIIGNCFKVTQTIKISVSLRPAVFDETFNTSVKTSYYNSIAELDRILLGMINSISNCRLLTESWKFEPIPKGYGVQTEPMSLQGSKLFNLIAYRTGSVIDVTVPIPAPQTPFSLEGDYNSWILKSYCPVTGLYASKVVALNDYLIAAQSESNVAIVSYTDGTFAYFGRYASTIVVSKAYSLTGKYYAIGAEDNDSINIYKDGVVQQNIALDNIGEGYQSVSPNGRWIAIYNGTGLRIYEGT